MLRRKALFFAAITLVIALILLRPLQGTSTSTLRRITNTDEQAVNLNPSLTDDGTGLVFESTADLAAVGSDIGFHSVRTDLSGEGPTFAEIARTRSVTPSLSHDGSKIAFASSEDLVGQNADRNSEIFFIDGRSLTQITRTNPGSSATRLADGNVGPSLSGNGRFIAFSSNRDLLGLNSDLNCEIFLYDLATASFTQLTNTNLLPGSLSPKISGDGSRVFFVRRDIEMSETADLMFLDRSTGAVRTLLSGAKNLSLCTGRALSNDGSRIVYSADIAANQNQVFLFDMLENSPRQLTVLPQTTTDVALHPTISGDGKRVAFTTRRKVMGSSDGSVEVYVLDIPTGQIEQVTNAPPIATAEVVSSLNFDGSLVAFNFPRALSGPVTSSDFANNSEIYIASASARPLFGAAVAMNTAARGNEPATTKTLAPESMVTIKGTALAFATQRATVAANSSLPLSLAGTTASVAGRPVRLLYVSPTELTLVLPADLADGAAEILITNSEGFQTKAPIVISHSAPGVFTVSGDGTGAGIILESDKLMAAPFDPTNGRLRLSIFATGLRHANEVSARLAGENVTVDNNIASPTLPGLDEIHIAVPASFRGTGVVTLQLTADGVESNSVNVTFGGSVLRDVMVNEFLADPPDGLAGDANHDGVRDASADEFVELVNASGRDLDLNGFQLLTRSAASSSDTVRHRFTARTILPSDSAIVIFGGGRPDPANPVFGGAQIVKASSGSLALNNSGGTITLQDSNSVVVTSITYGAAVGLPSGENQSLTRAPDIDGTFVMHTLAPSANGARFSPGTRTDSAPFLPAPAISSITIAPLFAELRVGDQSQFSARAFDENNADLAGVLFNWSSSNESVVTIDQMGLARAIGTGSAQIFALARGVRSNLSQVTVAQTTPTPTPTPIPTATPTPTPTATPTPTPTQTPTPTPTPAPTPTATPSPTPSPSPTPAPTPTATPTPTPSPSPTPAPTPTATPTPTPSPSPTPAPTPTATPTPTSTPTPTPTPSPTPEATVVISQIFGGGGNSGAQFRNDFIEIFNRGQAPIDLSGWSIQYASAAAATWSVTTLTPTTLAPGQYLLVQEASGGANGQTLPSPDVAGTIAMAAAAGKVALVRTSVALTGTCPSDTNILDFVGYGSTANCFRGSGPSLAPSNTNAILRGANGCTDTQRNANDFATAAPNPRNTSAAVNQCGTGGTAGDSPAVPPDNSGGVTGPSRPAGLRDALDLSRVSGSHEAGGSPAVPERQSAFDKATDRLDLRVARGP
jgi:uncharacterized protein (TIGR03437 family)